MNKKVSSSYSKESNNCKDIDPKLWDRLIWQEAMDRAIKKNRDKRTQKHVVNQECNTT